nr:U-box domain-containing protein 4-like [Ipomoea batatas]
MGFLASSATVARAYHLEVESYVKKLVEDLHVTSTNVLRNAAAELQLLANKILIANHGAISLLINLLYSAQRLLNYLRSESIAIQKVVDLGRMSLQTYKDRLENRLVQSDYRVP